MLLNLPQAAPSPTASVRPEALALDAQAGLLRYALGAFAVGMPLLGWVAGRAPNAAWLGICLFQFAVNWALFYVVYDWTRRRPERRHDVAARTRLHLLGGLLWAVAFAQMAVIGDAAGSAREALLLLSLGGAIFTFFFTAPHRLSLLVVGPLAAAPALILLSTNPASSDLGVIAQGAAAGAFGLAFILNHLLRQQFAMAAERETLSEDRVQALARAEALAKNKSDLLSTLSHEIRSGLSGVVHVLAAAAGANARSRPSREQLSAALDAARDLITVLDAALDSEQAEQGRLRLAVQAFAPARLAR